MTIQPEPDMLLTVLAEALRHVWPYALDADARAIVAALGDRADLMRAGLTPRGTHQPGDHHKYGPIFCEVCGVPGTLRLSVVPETFDGDQP